MPPVTSVSNPYAKRKPDPLITTNARAIERGNGHRSTGTTFRQAFRSVEETTHFRTETEAWNPRHGDAPVAHDVEAHSQSQQTFDSTAAQEQQRLEARDQHRLLQPHVLYVSTKQRGNGVLPFIRNVPFQYSTMVPDYILSSQRCALFLSIKYHNLYPEYIHRRIAELQTDFKLRILLVLIDVEDNANTLLHLNKLAVVHSLTLLLAWTEEEAARYLETYKAFDGKDASTIQKKEQTHFIDQVADVLGTIRSVNKTDSAQLLSQFTCLKAIMTASVDELVLCPGVGEKKVRRIHDAFHKPFSSQRAKQRKLEAQQAKGVIASEDVNEVKES